MIPAKIKIIDYKVAIQKNSFTDVRKLISLLNGLGFDVDYWANKEDGFDVYIIEDTDKPLAPNKTGYALVTESVIEDREVILHPGVWEIIKKDESKKISWSTFLSNHLQEKQKEFLKKNNISPENSHITNLVNTNSIKNNISNNLSKFNKTLKL